MNAKGWTKVKQIYENPGQRVKELKAEGNKIVGYVCYFAPPELISAAGLIPYRITGNLREPVTLGNAYYETIMCPYTRNLFDQGLKGAYDFLDGMIMSHSCDGVLRMFGAWSYYIKTPYCHLVNVPHLVNPSCIEFFHDELNLLRESLERYSGNRITDEKLCQVIDLYNQNRALVRELYEMRKREPPPISGTEMAQLLITGMLLPPEEFNILLKEIKEEVKGRSEATPSKARFLLYGSILDSNDFYKLVEGLGAKIVIDDTCIGTRCYWDGVSRSPDIMDGLVKRYFIDFKCPRTFRGTDSSARFDYIIDFAKDFDVTGVILYGLKYCDPHKFEIPQLTDHLAKAGLPTLYIEDDYTFSNLESLKSRVEGFIEIIT